MPSVILTRLRAKIDWLETLHAGHESFGEDPFEYERSAPIAPRSLKRFEARVGTRLPEDYREFLLELCNGIEGPGCTLTSLSRFELGEADELLALDADPVPASELDPCAHLLAAGCGETYFLVVGGPRAGEVWLDQSQGGWPVRQVARSFSGWYEHHLDVSLGVALAFAVCRSLVLGSPLPALMDQVAPLVETNGAAARLTQPAPRSDEDQELIESLRSLGFLRIAQGRLQEAEALFAEGRARFTYFGRGARSAPVYARLAQGDIQGALACVDGLRDRAGGPSELDVIRPLLAARLVS
jgi:hypothetical protein